MHTILVVDDSPSLLQMVSFTLENAGYELLLADSGYAALQLVKHHSVDLILSDINMDGLNGIQFVGRLKQMPQYRNIPVLMLTTESTRYKEDAKQLGVKGWIQKPVDATRLLTAVSATLEHKH